MASEGGGIREWINGPVGKWVVGVVVVLLVGGAVAMWVFRSPGQQAEVERVKQMGRKHPYACLNKDCGATGIIQVAWDATYPAECPVCHRKQAMTGFKCVNPSCGKIFAQSDKSVFFCPYCNKKYTNIMAGQNRP
ncbi:MAG TPA: hypothetical protein VFJ30_01405 [Phycisphaerae bacterium]|nr:hypothetical protein [Phycisphaerae bacterium]